jgi:ABC-2 type transport system permease protein
MFQSTTQGIVSLLEDRETDFAQEMFVAPISRYSIIIGKILGETMVATVMMMSQLILVLILQIQFDFVKFLTLFPALLLVAMLGGSMGIVIISFLNNQKSANQIFGFILFPQFFLAGIFSPINNFPFLLMILSRIVPLTYAVDLIRNIYYFDNPILSKITLFPIWTDILVIVAYIALFTTVGVYMFIRNERNK